MARFCGAFLCFGPLLYWTRAQLTQARSASDGTAPSLALRACVTPARAEGRPRRWRSGLVSLRPALSIIEVDGLDPQALERTFRNLLEVLRPAVQPDRFAGLRVDLPSELGGDHHLPTE